VLRLSDTAVGHPVELSSRDRGRFGMYICGVTVYDVPHIGHGRMALVFDVLRRYLEWTGLDVHHVSNITDIDDRIIQRAIADGVTTEAITERYEAAWWDAVDALGVRRPDADPHATAYVDGMVELVARLVANGSAYETADGVYLSVATVPDYGLLARQPLESLRAGARVDVDTAKRSPLDFALWKLAKPGEPRWPSPWGEGRPGWHTECVVMSLGLLGEGFDLHGGGLDLAFPHHENERAQALADGRTFAGHWVHNGMVEVGGEKMSKSLGNYTSLTDLLASNDGRTYRLLVLQSHYRAPVEITPRTLKAAANTIAGLDDLARRSADLPEAAAEPEVMARFRAAMDDDLDTPAVMALVADVRRRANAALQAGSAAEAAPLRAALAEMTDALGLVLAWARDEIPVEVEALANRREAARRARDFAAADGLRSDLAARGWVVEDTPQGPRLHRA